MVNSIYKMGFLPFVIYYHYLSLPLNIFFSMLQLWCTVQLFKIPPPPTHKIPLFKIRFRKVVFSIFKTPILELNFYHRL